MTINATVTIDDAAWEAGIATAQATYNASRKDDQIVAVEDYVTKVALDALETHKGAVVAEVVAKFGKLPSAEIIKMQAAVEAATAAEAAKVAAAEAAAAEAIKP